MKNDIIRKLTSELHEPFRTERQTVYLLVEIRKLLDLTTARDTYQALRFYCDWAVHVEMSRSTAKKVVGIFDEYQQAIDASMDTPYQQEAGDARLLERISQTLELRSFRQELHAFLSANDLPNHITADNILWGEFISLYLSVIEDCPLVGRADLQHVRRVQVSVTERKDGTDAEAAGYHVKVVWAWESMQMPIAVQHVSTF